MLLPKESAAAVTAFVPTAPNERRDIKRGCAALVRASGAPRSVGQGEPGAAPRRGRTQLFAANSGAGGDITAHCPPAIAAPLTTAFTAGSDEPPQAPLQAAQ